MAYILQISYILVIILVRLSPFQTNVRVKIEGEYASLLYLPHFCCQCILAHSFQMTYQAYSKRPSRHYAVGNVDLTEAIMNETGETVVNEEPVSVSIVDDDQDINELPTPESMADGTCK